MYDANDLEKEPKVIPLPEEIAQGWGITHDNDYLYISNGSPYIYICEAETLKILNRIETP